MKRFLGFFQKLPVVIALCMVFLGSFSVGVITKVSYKHWFNEGVRAYNKHNYQEAGQYFKKSILANPDFSPSRYYYAVSLQTQYITQPNLLENASLEIKTLGALQDVIDTNENFQEIDFAHACIADIYRDSNQTQRYREWILKRAELPQQISSTKAISYYTLAASYWAESYQITQQYLIPRTQPAQYRPITEWKYNDSGKIHDLVKTGLSYIEKCMAIDPRCVNCYYYQNLLIRELVKIEIDPKLKYELLVKEPCGDIEFQHLNRELSVP